MGVLFEDPPSQKMRYVLDVMEKSLDESVPVQLMLPRGAGKTTATEALLLYLLLYGMRKFVVIVSANARSASNILRDIWRVIQDTDTPIAQDFPEVCLPYSLTGGATRRRQLFNGTSTDLQRTMTDLVFPRLKRKDGTEYPTSGSVLTVRGITSGIRGLKRNALRPDCVLLDDLQTSSTASNQDQVEKLYQLINADIMNLSSKGKIGVISCATPIMEDDLTYRVKKDVNWRTLEFPYVIKFPDDWAKGDKSLWAQYFKLYDDESLDRRKHTDSLKFYEDNKNEMDKGAELFSERYSPKDGQVSGLQAIMDKLHLIGERAFMAEYQMTPVQTQNALPINPSIVVSRISPLHEMELPKENVVAVFASTDINASKYLTTTICAFLRDQTVHVIYHKFRKCCIHTNIPEQQYYKEVYDLLGVHGRELKKLCDDNHVKLTGWAIDQNGLPWNAVSDFCHNSMKICGLSACGFVGKASTQFRSFVRSRLKEEVNRTLLCGDDAERKVSGTGRKWMYWDSCLYREKVQKGFLTEVGNIGSIQWYKGGNHNQWAVQVCNERLVSKKLQPDGQWSFIWRDVGENHDVLDSLAQCLACYSSMGYSTGDTGRMQMNVSIKRNKRPRVRIV